MRLKLGDEGEPVKVFQRALNRLGSLLLVDGEFGAGTQAAVGDAWAFLKRAGPPEADDALLADLSALPEPSPELTAPGVTFIGREEISSPARYRALFRHPVWPTANSGITIGIGYDLRHVTRAELRADWSGVLDAPTLARLGTAIRVPGSPALVAALGDIDVPLPGAMAVFLRRMVPTHAGRTRSIYPSLDALPPARRTALISLVFNRGTDLEGDRRSEMKRIQGLLASGDLDPVAQELETMTRHWNPATERGVIERRRREATLWRDGFSALRFT